MVGFSCDTSFSVYELILLYIYIEPEGLINTKIVIVVLPAGKCDISNSNILLIEQALRMRREGDDRIVYSIKVFYIAGYSRKGVSGFSRGYKKDP